MLSFAAWVSICLVFAFAILQLSLTIGAPFGEYVLGGTHKVLPGNRRFISGAFSCLFFVVGCSYLQKTEIILPIFNVTFVNILLVAYTLFLIYAIIGNGFITKSKKEKYVMTPLSIIGCISSIYLLLNSYIVFLLLIVRFSIGGIKWILKSF
jgi:hypothetical protein